MKTNTSFTNKIYIWKILSKVLSLRTAFPDLKVLPWKIWGKHKASKSQDFQAENNKLLSTRL